MAETHWLVASRSGLQVPANARPAQVLNAARSALFLTGQLTRQASAPQAKASCVLAPQPLAERSPLSSATQPSRLPSTKPRLLKRTSGPSIAACESEKRHAAQSGLAWVNAAMPLVVAAVTP